jgi:hypothetical protein
VGVPPRSPPPPPFTHPPCLDRFYSPVRCAPYPPLAVCLVVQLFADIMELVLFVVPILYLARFQILKVYRVVADALRARRDKRVQQWRQRHLDIVVAGQRPGGGAGAPAGRGADGGVELHAVHLSDKDRHNLTAISDVLDEVSRKAAMDAELTLRKARMRA